ncbi:MAG: helix-hairpin-helix domain-containing protein [Mycobacteriales bacterium]
MVWGSSRTAQGTEQARGRLARLLGEHPAQLVGRTELIPQQAAPVWPAIHTSPGAPGPSYRPQPTASHADTGRGDAHWLLPPTGHESGSGTSRFSLSQDLRLAGDQTPQSEVAPLPWWRAARIDPTRRGVAAAAIGAVTVLVILGALFGVKLWQRDAAESAPVPLPEVTSQAAGTEKGASPGTATDKTRELVIAVSGKVLKPGLVRVPDGARVDDAIQAAGGMTPGTSLGDLNLARKVVDGELIVVGGPPPPAPPGGSGSVSPDGAGSPSGVLLDLNSATVTQLDALPGLGPVMAQRILDYRSAHGRFGSVGELRKVDGIGEVKFAKLKPLVTV